MSQKSVFVGGWHSVTAVLQGQRQVFEIHLRRGSGAERGNPKGEQIIAMARAQNVVIHDASDADLARMLPNVNHQGCIAAVAPEPPLAEGDLEDLLQVTENPLLLVLDQVQDPHNLGACLRSAAAAGAHALIMPKDRSAALTPAARKVAAGGAELVPLVRITNLARCLKTLQQYGVWVVGTAADARQTIHAVDLRGPMALVLGGEAGGLRRLTAQNCDVLASIPMPGAVESLNVSVAAGVCLFEAVRQRTKL